MNRRFRVLAPVLLLVVMVAIAGCKKKQPPPPAATAPPPSPAPTAQITATPSRISAGEQVTVSWRTTDASSAVIDGLGDVPTSGTKTVTPSSSTTYRLVARGDGGTADASAEVTVVPPPPVSQPSHTMSAEEEFRANVHDVFFDYDAYDIRSDAQSTLSQDASYLASHANVKVVIGGYCDERGSDEYNLALGQNRANATKNALVTAGIAADRIRVVSYGKEKPFCSDSSEQCWQQNRRAGFSLDQ
ncbi:MAG TPA: peptidoglycan-associated lipoprotein Pal [Terracidiphilus sp.]|nr:peptidoglycan-associated lipoprotein Pal [Terracidiphilus sp.]